MKKGITNIDTKLVLVSFVFVILGCSNSTSSKALNNSKKDLTAEANLSQSIKLSLDRTPHFLKLSENAQESYIGFLQGVKQDSSAGPYLMREFNSDSISFVLLFNPKAIKKDLVTFETLKAAEAESYKDFDCFAFVYKMRSPDQQKEYHEDNVVYPLIVKTYKRLETDDWSLVSEHSVKNLLELSLFEIKCINHK